MSAISRYAYYVHYHAVNAVKNAPIKSDTYFSEYALYKLSEPRILANSGISKQTKRELADMIEGLHDASKLKADVDRDKVWNDIRDLLNRQWNGIWANARLDEATGRVLTTGRGGLHQQRVHSRYIETSQLTAYINQLQQIMTQVGTATTLSPDDRSELLQKCNEVINEINYNVQVGFASNGALIDTSGKEVVKYGNTFLKQGVEYARVSNIVHRKIQAINELLAQLPALYTGMNVATGLSEEALTMEAAMLVAGIGVSNVVDYMKRGLDKAKSQGLGASNGMPMLTGQYAPKLEYLINGIPAEAQARIWKSDRAYTQQIDKDTAIIVDVKGSQQKVDVIATLPTTDPAYASGLKAVPISVKNRNLSAAIHEGIGLVDKTNVWYLMQDEKVAFLRRYLNVLADREETKAQEDSDENTAISQLIRHKDDALLATKLLTAYKALSGDTFGRQRAEMFVLYDSAGKKSYVVDIGDIMKALLLQIVKNPQNIDHYFKSNVIATLGRPLKNNYQADVHIRMGELIADIRERNLSVAFNTAGFKDLMSIIEKY